MILSPNYGAEGEGRRAKWRRGKNGDRPLIISASGLSLYNGGDKHEGTAQPPEPPASLSPVCAKTGTHPGYWEGLASQGAPKQNSEDVC